MTTSIGTLQDGNNQLGKVLTVQMYLFMFEKHYNL